MFPGGKYPGTRCGDGQGEGGAQARVVALIELHQPGVSDGCTDVSLGHSGQQFLGVGRFVHPEVQCRMRLLQPVGNRIVPGDGQRAVERSKVVGRRIVGLIDQRGLQIQIAWCQPVIPTQRCCSGEADCEMAVALAHRAGEGGAGVDDLHLEFHPELIGERSGEVVFEPGRAGRPQIISGGGIHGRDPERARGLNLRHGRNRRLTGRQQGQCQQYRHPAQ